MSNISSSDLKTEIQQILKDADLENTSAKKVRLELQLKLDCDLTERKKEVDKFVMEVINEQVQEEEEEEDSSGDEGEIKKIKSEQEEEVDSSEEKEEEVDSSEEEEEVVSSEEDRRGEEVDGNKVKTEEAHEVDNSEYEVQIKKIEKVKKEYLRPLITTNNILDSVSEKGIEVCILRVPKTLNIKDLRNCDLSDSFNIEGTQFSLTQHKEEKPLLAVTLDDYSQFSMIKLKAKKIYTISECFAEPVKPKVEIPPRYIVPQITDIKQRHPIYGAEYVRDLKRKYPDLELETNLSVVKREVKEEEYIHEDDQQQQPKKKKKKKDKKREA